MLIGLALISVLSAVADSSTPTKPAWLLLRTGLLLVAGLILHFCSGDVGTQPRGDACRRKL
ncbi:MAG: hypothetical protein ACYC9Z_09590 [Casimicrobiaceae bacterium]